MFKIIKKIRLLCARASFWDELIEDKTTKFWVCPARERDFGTFLDDRPSKKSDCLARERNFVIVKIDDLRNRGTSSSETGSHRKTSFKGKGASVGQS